MNSDLVVIITPTIMDGRVVRWYQSLNAAEQSNEIVSASRNGVRVECFVSPDGVESLVALIREARKAADLIRSGKDVSHLATHDKPFGARELVAL
jgi:hypothetical protein